MKINAAGNTEIPAYLVLVEFGYVVSRAGRNQADGEQWTAKKEGNTFTASSPLELLGLVTIGEARGSNWLATDDEIDAFMKTYYGSD